LPRSALLALLLALPLGCASRRVDVLESGDAVLRVRADARDPAALARRVTLEALAPEQFLDPNVRAGFEASLGGALQVDPAAVLVGQNPVTFPLPMPAGVQVAVGYDFETPRVAEEQGWVRVRCPMHVSMALLEVPAPRAGSYDALAVWAALGYLARSLQDAGFELHEGTAERLRQPPFEPGSTSD